MRKSKVIRGDSNNPIGPPYVSTSFSTKKRIYALPYGDGLKAELYVRAGADGKPIDPSRIALVGYAMGGNVALLSAASSDKVKLIASVGGFPVLRLQSIDKGTEGIRHFSHLHGLIPRFGFFVGNEERLPLDFDEVLGLVAPKPALIVAPTLDRHMPLDDVRHGYEAARHAYRIHGSEEKLELETPQEIGRFTTSIQNLVFDWLENNL